MAGCGSAYLTPKRKCSSLLLFDLRPIGRTASPYNDLAGGMLAKAKTNFFVQMVSNPLKHTPPLGLFCSFALTQSGKHKNMVDQMHSGVAPVVGMGCNFEIRGAVETVKSRVRINAAREFREISDAGEST